MATKYLIFSVFSPETQSYPYNPFVAESVYGGIQQFIKFIKDREKICPNPKLHLIGECLGFSRGLDNFQPYLAPKEVILSDNFLSWTFVNLIEFSLNLQKYLKHFKENFKCQKRK